MYEKWVFPSMVVGDIWNEFTKVCVIFDVVNTLTVKELRTYLFNNMDHNRVLTDTSKNYLVETNQGLMFFYILFIHF